jgi:radical SAM protein with 4Fe4S-binding SPASM domain
MGAITDKPRGNMSMDTFTSLIDDTADYASIAVLWMWGEPFVNSRVFDMIAYAHSKNIATVASTNGQHVQSREDAERLVKSGLDNLVVALDGATQEVYSTYRVGGDIRKIMRCLELIRQAKDSLGSLSPRVNVRTVVMKHNEHELPDIEQIAVKYGADMVSKKTAFLPDYYKADADHDFAPSDPRYRRFKYQNDQRIRRSQHHFHCHRPWIRMSVTADGTVLPCEFDFNETAIFGIGGNSTSFADVWQSEAAAAFRKQFLRDRSVYKFCAECHFRDRSDSQCTAEMKYLR